MNQSAEIGLDSRWIVGRRFDASFILLGGLAVSAACILTARLGVGFLAIAVGFAVVLDYPHVMQTWVRILMDRDEARIYGRGFLASLAAFAACAAYLRWQVGLPFLIMIWLYWQPYHVIKQHVGIAKIYNGKNGYRGPFVTAQASLILGCAAPILYRMSTAGFAFDRYSLWGRELPFSGLRFPVPPVPHAVVVIAYVFLAGFLLRTVAEQISLARRGEPTLPPATIGNLSVAIVSYNVAYLLVPNLYATILIASAVHSFQYHALCWGYNHRKAIEPPRSVGTADAASRLLTSLSQRRAIPYYAAFILSLGIAVSLLDLVASGLVPLIITLHHFYFDGLIWKSNNNPNLKVGLGFKGPRPA